MLHLFSVNTTNIAYNISFLAGILFVCICALIAWYLLAKKAVWGIKPRQAPATLARPPNDVKVEDVDEAFGPRV